MIKLSKLNKYRLPGGELFDGGDYGGAFHFTHKGSYLRVIASVGEGWDHVSVSLIDRTPTWEEMELIKRKFFRPDETAMQLHVPIAEHININPNVLHLWRPHHRPIPLPPKHLV